MPHKLYFDGCSKGNPGPSGIGAVIYMDEQVIWSGSDFLGDFCTNNQSEYSALIFGLNKCLQFNFLDLEVYGDSLLVINQTNGKFKVSNKGLQPLHKTVIDLKSKFNRITFSHVPREKNTCADSLSNLGLTKRQG